MFASPLSRSYLLLADPRDFGCDGCPESRLLITNDPDLAHRVDDLINVAALAVFGLTLLFVCRHWRRATPAERQAVGPVLLTGATVMALLVAGLVAQLSGYATAAELGYYATQVAILPLPYMFLVTLARSRLTRADAVSELVTRLGEAHAQGEMREALSRAVGDPSLELAYWLPDFETYADLDGRPVEVGDCRRAVRRR